MKKFKHTKKNMERFGGEEGADGLPAPKKWKWKTSYTVGIFIIFVMVFSVVGFLNTEEPNTYNNTLFVQVQNGWIAKTDWGRLMFSTHPSNVETIAVPLGVTKTLQNSRVIMLTHNPDDPNKGLLATLSYNFLRLVEMENKETQKNKQVFFAVTSDTSPTTPANQTNQTNQTEQTQSQQSTHPNLKIVDCKDASPYVPVVKYETVNRSVINGSTNITFSNNCIILRGASEPALVEVGDRLLYSYLGIIDESKN